MRYKLTIEYDGTDFVGWQRQKDGLGVQEVIETAIKNFCGEDVEIYGAGRTDAGVHALGQVAHFETQKEWRPDTVRDAINAHIDKKHKTIILDCEVVEDDFHARFSAQERSYIYKIANRKSRLTLDEKRAWWIPMRLDIENMKKCADILIGEHDFTSFRASECQAKSPIKSISEITITQNHNVTTVFVRARSFLHHQVRNIVGTLFWAGQGKITPIQMQEILDLCDRRKAGPTAPAHGLYFLEVQY